MDSLIALARAEQERAKTLLRRRIVVVSSSLALSLIALFLESAALYLSAVLVLVGNMAGWWLRWLAAEAHSLAEEGRRRGVLRETLGADLDVLGAAELLTKFSDAARANTSKWEDSDYFATKEESGPERLRLALLESSFWSARLYRTSGRVVAVRLTIVASAIVLSIIIITLAGTPDASTLAARVAVVTLSALVGLDELGLMLGFFGASQVADRVTRLLHSTDANNLSQMLVAHSDYSVATASAAPIPTGLYKRKKNSIERAWAEAMGVQLS